MTEEIAKYLGWTDQENRRIATIVDNIITTDSGSAHMYTQAFDSHFAKESATMDWFNTSYPHGLYDYGAAEWLASALVRDFSGPSMSILILISSLSLLMSRKQECGTVVSLKC